LRELRQDNLVAIHQTALLTARKFKPGETVDFVVVGSGAAGGVMARELSQAGFTVVVLEQGPRLGPGDFEHDELKYSYLSGITNDPAVSPQTFRDDPARTAERPRIGNSLVYARIVGGSSTHFTANYWRFHANDFNERSLLGGIPGTGFADWPISYEELEPYYTKVEWEVGVSGLAYASPFDPPRTKPYPMPPLPVKSSGVLFERGARKLGLHPFPAPMAIVSRLYRGRPACAHCGFCIGFGCEVMAKSSTLYTMIPEAEATGLLTSVWIAAHWPAIAAAAHHAEIEFFDAADAADVEVIAAQIVPSGATPGAREAHAVHFIDRALATFFSGWSQNFRAGLAQFQSGYRASNPASASFAKGGPDTQIAYLGTVDRTPFFETVRTLTLLGMFASPQYGGN